MCSLDCGTFHEPGRVFPWSTALLSPLSLASILSAFSTSSAGTVSWDHPANPHAHTPHPTPSRWGLCVLSFELHSERVISYMRWFLKMVNEINIKPELLIRIEKNKRPKISSVGKDMEQVEPLPCWCECELVQQPLENHEAVSTNAWTNLRPISSPEDYTRQRYALTRAMYENVYSNTVSASMARN